jgi:nucleotide-binding universal stress UspA family protein
VEGIARVLCPVDIGQPGQAAFEQALALARAHAATLIVVCAVPRNQSFNTGATKRVSYLLNLRAAAEAAGVDVRVDVQHGEGGCDHFAARSRPPARSDRVECRTWQRRQWT